MFERSQLAPLIITCFRHPGAEPQFFFLDDTFCSTPFCILQVYSVGCSLTNALISFTNIHFSLFSLTEITSSALDLFTYTPSPTTSTTVVSITCGDPPGVANSSRQVTGHAVGDFTVYWCDLGYEPVGNTTVQCQSTGLWTIAPVCKGKPYITTLQIKT